MSSGRRGTILKAAAGGQPAFEPQESIAWSPFAWRRLANCTPWQLTSLFPSPSRLQQQAGAAEATLTVELRAITDKPSEEQPLRLWWHPSSAGTLPFAVQDAPLTEWAALGVACAVIWHFGGLRLHPVAAVGDSFDYWVRREDLEFGLEVSGTLAVAPLTHGSPLISQAFLDIARYRRVANKIRKSSTRRTRPSPRLSGNRIHRDPS